MLISQDGLALLCDFGIARLLRNNVTIEGTSTLKGSARWMAPELLDPPSEPPIKPGEHQFQTSISDVWAFGMTVYVGSEYLPRGRVLTTLQL